MRTELLLGRDYPDYSAVHFREMDGETLAAISTGGDPDSPSLLHKGDPLIPNEDAILMMQEGSQRLLAVADGHHGCGASHAVLETLATSCRRIPETPRDLQDVLRLIERMAWPDNSGTTLTLACLNAEANLCFGVQWGDSALLTFGEKGALYRTESGQDYLHKGCSTGQVLDFQFPLTGVSTVALFSDGIFECHYRSPLTSIRPAALHSMWQRCQPDLRRTATVIVAAALAGVNGYPGGQDNISLVLAST
jgi:serine/threonine protein phosphatase PrpC